MPGRIGQGIAEGKYLPLLRKFFGEGYCFCFLNPKNAPSQP